MTELSSWTRGRHNATGVTHDTYRRGSGPGVIVIHEIPGITPKVITFADEVVDRGFTVVMPHLFGSPGAAKSVGAILSVTSRVCISKEFNKLKLGATSPHSTLTEHRQQAAVDRVLDFFDERLKRDAS